MVSHEEVESLGFTKVDAWSTDVVDSYVYRANRYDKPRNTINQYRLDRLIDTDYMELVATLQRETDFIMRLDSFNGEIEDVDSLFELFELMKEHARTI